ncbi:hypothetical protein IAT40_008012 [Kwoniella sp. CBS 6097]
MSSQPPSNLPYQGGYPPQEYVMGPGYAGPNDMFLSQASFQSRPSYALPYHTGHVHQHHMEGGVTSHPYNGSTAWGAPENGFHGHAPPNIHGQGVVGKDNAPPSDQASWFAMRVRMSYTADCPSKPNDHSFGSAMEPDCGAAKELHQTCVKVSAIEPLHPNGSPYTETKINRTHLDADRSNSNRLRSAANLSRDSTAYGPLRFRRQSCLVSSQSFDF